MTYNVFGETLNLAQSINQSGLDVVDVAWLCLILEQNLILHKTRVKGLETCHGAGLLPQVWTSNIVGSELPRWLSGLNHC